MMYLIGMIAFMVIISTASLQLKIRKQKKEIAVLTAEKKKVDIKLDIAEKLLAARAEIKKNQDTIDKGTSDIDDTIPEGQGDLTDEEKIVADSITARLTDQL